MRNVLILLRVANDLKPKEVAQRTGLKIGTIYKLEMGETNTTYGVLKLYAKAFNMNVVDIYSLIELKEQGLTMQEILDIYLEYVYLNKPLYKVV